ncbi:SdiA-regulated domain-containing protein [Methylotenera sp. L2L1]|uniref:SdiA-regulated domain-containing protein n=1 Tax=Methylotenera sp. L2L1 TaxID=1502770 RepID=UPI00056A1689|nr:SdiA-regulated domain-containing protein [Methylotenera sp. L2L1]
MPQKNKRRWILALFILILASIYCFRLEALAWYVWHNNQSASEQATKTLDLKNYHVEIDGLSIPDLANASGFTYNTRSNTLFTVLNKEAQIIELSLTGKVIRRVDVTGVSDMEGITHVADSRYVIADESDNRLVLVTLDDDATSVDVTNAPKLKLGLNFTSNKNFEGVSWDGNNHRLLVVKERDPKYILSVEGFFEAKAGESLEIKRLDQYDAAIKWSLRDLSSVTYHDETDSLVLLSDESRLIKEYDAHGHAVGALALWKGFHGLSQHVPQAEGIAIGPDGSIYIMSEPNLFYVFKHRQP